MPSYAERSNVWAVLVCEALGLDKNRVSSIRIVATPGDVLTVTVDMLANAEELAAARQALLASIGKVRLVSVPTETTIAIDLADTTTIDDGWERHA